MFVCWVALFYCHNANMMGKSIYVINLNKPTGHFPRVAYCSSFFCRLRGLMFRSRISPNEGLLLVQSKRDSRMDSSIHMLFVPFDLAVFWINSDMQVVDKVIAKPWKPAYLSAKPARFVLEIHPDHWGTYEIGDTVEFQNA
ncbi:MAG: hypothetical protein Kow002_00550 [Anaerolineales bacterium]